MKKLLAAALVAVPFLAATVAYPMERPDIAAALRDEIKRLIGG